MRYLKTKNQYKASNFMFDCNTKESWSYDWWCFSRIYKGRLIFNHTRYSQSTCRHQSKALSLLGYNVDFTLHNTTSNLTDVEDALRDEIKNTKFEIRNIIKAIRNPRSQPRKNKERKGEITKLLIRINVIRDLLNE
jgi:hypothetical protein